MKRTDIWLRTRDVDWAIKIGRCFIHVCSAGDDLPDVVEEHLFDIWDALKGSRLMCGAEDVVLNEDYLNKKFPVRQGENIESSRFQREWYVHSFKAMARKGFYSFDRDISTPVMDSKYNLIAWPKEGTKVPEIPLLAINKEINISQLCGKNLVTVINDLWKEENDGQ